VSKIVIGKDLPAMLDDRFYAVGVQRGNARKDEVHYTEQLNGIPGTDSNIGIKSTAP